MTQFCFHLESPMDFDWSTRAMWKHHKGGSPSILYLFIYFLKSGKKERSKGETVKQVKKKLIKKLIKRSLMFSSSFPTTWGLRSLKPKTPISFAFSTIPKEKRIDPWTKYRNGGNYSRDNCALL